MEGFAVSDTEVGYVKNRQKDFLFPVTRTVTARVYPHNGKYYFRTREIISVLGVKQQFQFVDDCRKIMGADTIINGEKTKPFRGEENTDRVTFISADDLYAFLSTPFVQNSNKPENGMLEKVMRELRNYLTDEE